MRFGAKARRAGAPGSSDDKLCRREGASTRSSSGQRCGRPRLSARTVPLLGRWGDRTKRAGTPPCAASERIRAWDATTWSATCRGFKAPRRMPLAVAGECPRVPHLTRRRGTLLDLQGPWFLPAIIFVAATSSAERQRITLPMKASAQDSSRSQNTSWAHTTAGADATSRGNI